MRTRRTSRLVLEQIREGRLLPRQRMAIYTCLFDHGPMTITECFARLTRSNSSLNWNTRSRFTELREQGAIYEVSERVCTVTSQTVIEWDVTADVPRPLARRPPATTRRKLEQRVTDLELENARLRKRIEHLEREPQLDLFARTA